MKRMESRDLSYTNLAAMAEEFGTFSRVLPSGSSGRTSTATAQDSGTSYARAMELINTGLRLDTSSPLEAIESYQRGGDLLSRVLESAPPDAQSHKMQQTLDMIEERVRYLTRSAVGKPLTDSANVSSLPSPRSTDVGVVTSEPPPVPDAATDSVTMGDGGELPSDKHVYNLFNLAAPDRLPRELWMVHASFGGGIFADLRRAFGFQHESALNQTEHLLLLLANVSSREPDGIGTLHRRLMRNYRSWAVHLGVSAQCAAASDVSQNKVADLALWLLIWGEAANLRHMPECLCFLFHNTRAELWDAPLHMPRRRPPGWFLSRVVAPLYHKVRAEAKRTGERGKPLGHTRKANYDDFNEFFWRRQCLQYSYFAPEEELGHLPPSGSDPVLSSPALSGSVSEVLALHAPELQRPLPPIDSFPACKRYVERRSWLHPIRSFWRVHSFLFVALHFLLVLSFLEGRTGLVLDGALLQALLGCLLTLSGTSLIGDLLDAFTQHGALHQQLSDALSLSVRVAAKAAVGAALAVEYLQLMTDAPLAKQHVPPSVWASTVLAGRTRLLAAAAAFALPSLIVLLANCVPCVSSHVRSWRGPLKSLADLLEPLNRLYVGRDVHVRDGDAGGCGPVLEYDIFWFTLLCFKLSFSYAFQLRPLVRPTRDAWTLDLSSWWPGHDLGAVPNVIVVALHWAPVVLMYLLDLQIWFILWQAAYGTIKGWTLHIGEVPDFATLRERFFDASDAFNRKVLSSATHRGSPEYVPPGGPPPRGTKTRVAAAGTAPARPLDDLRVGLLSAAGCEHVGGGEASERMRYFAEAWNGIIDDLRKADLVSGREHALLAFNGWHGSAFSCCVYLPGFVTAGKLAEAFHFVRQASDAARYQPPRKRSQIERSLVASIDADRPARFALREFAELSSWLLSTLLGPRHEAAIGSVAQGLLRHQTSHTLLDVLVPSKLPALATAIVGLARSLLKLVDPSDAPAPPPSPPRRMRPPRMPAGAPAGADFDPLRGTPPPPVAAPSKVLSADASPSAVVDGLRGVLDALKGALGELDSTIEALKFTPQGFFWDEAYAKERILATLLADQPPAWRALGQPATRRLEGLVSLCVTAQLDAEPRHPEVLRRLRWFVGSLFMAMPEAPPVEEALSQSTLTPFCAEDILFGMRELVAKNEDGVSVLYFLKTVHPDEWSNFLERVGVKASEEARLFKEKDLVLELRAWASFRGQTLMRTVEGMMCHERALRLLARWEGYEGESLEQLVRSKYSYVVSCQLYGTHKRNRDPKAADTEFLLQRFPNLRVAYVDKTSTLTKVREPDGTLALRETIRYYSVLIKGCSDGGEEAVQQVYRVQLPGDIMIGEGKPENQNHAVIFTRGETIQAIDMNQSGYFEEALKMRNLLQEFRIHPTATIVGFREHIFTGELSSLASYMALQEGCFVTLTQRVLSDPLHIRQHYGHPDVFDKIFAMSTGGVSKASKGINLSEDVYAGFNTTLRGGTVPYAEYVQVGKGRDVGMQQIYKFEAKLASGNAEQCLSRDVFRIAQRLDLTRSFSFYYSGPGFYFNNAATVFALFFFLYVTLLPHLLQLDVGVPVADLLNAQWVVQLGLLLNVPILCYLAVEHGVVRALLEMWRVNVSGSLLFFMFHMGTKAYYFDSTLKYGGAKYRPTGRGFVMRHEEFAELYRFYSGSHLYNGFELVWGLILLWTLGAWKEVGGGPAYLRTCWSIWAVAFAWLFSPFWFNPLAFDMKKNLEDLWQWLRWMERLDSSVTTSWEAWWREEREYLQTGSWAKKAFILLPGVRYGLTSVGILVSVSRRAIASGALLDELQLAALLVGGTLAIVLAFLWMPLLLRARPVLLRLLSSALLAFSLFYALPWVGVHVSLLHALHLFVAAAYLTAALIRIPYAFGQLPYFVLIAGKAYDYLLGGLLIGLCLLLSATPGQVMRHLQNRALLSDAFNRGVYHAELAQLISNQN